MATPREKFQALLRELFQFDSADLDFGIYRVMKHKRVLIEQFIEKDLLSAVSAELSTGAVRAETDLARQVAEKAEAIRTMLGADYLDGDGNMLKGQDSQLGREYLELRKKAGGAKPAEALEALAFNHLIQFFARFYDQGDFLSLRQYSRQQRYAIPYNGEEVYLHWANRDQYYIKTTENFSTYRWVAETSGKPISVLFRITHAEVTKDNIKNPNNPFYLPQPDTLTWDPAERTVTLDIHFRGLTAPEESLFGTQNKQDTIVAKALAALETNSLLADKPELKTALFGPQPGPDGTPLKDKEDKPVPRIRHHLRRYVSRNTSDYFIHKDLAAFLTRELDFYLKNEVLLLDDIESGGPARAEGWFQLMRGIRAVGVKVIEFLAQIENFQKRLFEKKKLITDVQYCVTLDRVPASLYPEIAANEAQRAEWVRLFAIDEIKACDIPAPKQGDLLKPKSAVRIPKYTAPLTAEFLKANRFLVLDTALFSPEFKDKLLASKEILGRTETLDDATDGLLIRSENFQALNFLQARYRDTVNCIYIDPPYNTASSAIPYKNNYRHSSWATMMHDRLAMLRPTMTSGGAIFVSIDKLERTVLEHALNSVFGSDNRVEELIWSMNTTNSQAPNYSTNHEYVEVYAKDRATAEQDPAMFREPKPGYAEVMALVEKLNPSFPSISKVESELHALYERRKHEYQDEIEAQGLDWESEKGNDPWRGLFNYSRAEYRDAKGHLVPEAKAKEKKAHIWIWQEADASMPAAKQAESTKDPKSPNWRFYTPSHPVTGKPCPHPKSGWKFAYADDEDSPDRRSFVSLDRDHRIAWGPDEAKVPRLKRMLHEAETNIGKSVFQDYNDGEKQTSAMFGKSGLFLAPKHAAFVSRFIVHAAKHDSVILDVFGGSGSTAHAVISLNREDNGRRKYVLAEIGDHFDTLLKPRVLKAAYSRDWRSGKPLSREGISHCVKVIRLESYEDTLGNIGFSNENEGQSLMSLEGYSLRYMLDFETRGSKTFLNVDQLRNPFSYTLDIKDGQVTTTKTVDLPETFAYVLGLITESRSTHERKAGKTSHRYLVYRGKTRDHGTLVAVLWREIEGWKEDDFQAEREWLAKDKEMKKLLDGVATTYVNGTSTIENAESLDPIFKRLLFAPVVTGTA
jgi:adenine-specific DNA-methyltransferase